MRSGCGRDTAWKAKRLIGGCGKRVTARRTSVSHKSLAPAPRPPGRVLSGSQRAHLAGFSQAHFKMRTQVRYRGESRRASNRAASARVFLRRQACTPPDTHAGGQRETRRSVCLCRRCGAEVPLASPEKRKVTQPPNRMVSSHRLRALPPLFGSPPPHPKGLKQSC